MFYLHPSIHFKSVSSWQQCNSVREERLCHLNGKSTQLKNWWWDATGDPSILKKTAESLLSWNLGWIIYQSLSLSRMKDCFLWIQVKHSFTMQCTFNLGDAGVSPMGKISPSGIYTIGYAVHDVNQHDSLSHYKTCIVSHITTDICHTFFTTNLK